MTEDWKIKAAVAALDNLEDLEREYLQTAMLETFAIYEGFRPSDAVSPDPVTPTVPQSFPVFATLASADALDLWRFNIGEMKIHYEKSLLTDGEIDRAKITEAARKSPQISMVDIETWWGENGAPTTDDNIERYVEAMRLYQEQLPANHLAGLYSTLPTRHYWAVIRKDSKPDAYEAWVRNNERLKPIAEHVDFTAPSLYTFYRDRNDDWVEYAAAQMQQAKMIAPDVPCYGTLWPMYHDQSGPIGRDFWRLQLETVKEHADGVYIWDDLKQTAKPFDELDGWWDETLDFINDLG